RFKLAHGVIKLSHVWLKGLEVVAVARPILEELRDATGETAALFRLEEDRGICILECESRHVLSISRGVGDSLKIAQGATGKAMLAFMPAERQAAFLAHLPRDGQRIHLEEALRTAVHQGTPSAAVRSSLALSPLRPLTSITAVTSSAQLAFS